MMSPLCVENRWTLTGQVAAGLEDRKVPSLSVGQGNLVKRNESPILCYF